jgi:fatty-acyl-CoA synthase
MAFTLPGVLETVAAAVPDREAIVCGSRRVTYGRFDARANALGHVLLEHGLTVERERSALADHESGQPHVALYLYNGPEYLEGMFGAWKARCAPFNVNYRYVEDELLYLFENAGARAVVYQAEFAPQIERVRDRLPRLELLLQVADDSGNALLDGALDYETALAEASESHPATEPSPDDLYILYTGGTTGMPKGVLWRAEDIFIAAMGGRKQTGEEIASYEELAEMARAGAGNRMLVGPPLMHGAAQWGVVSGMTGGSTAVFPSDVRKLDAPDFLSTAVREKVGVMTIVGDAFARPLIDELRRTEYDLSALKVVSSGGAPISGPNKEAFFDFLPDLVFVDGMGSSEAGVQAMQVSTRGQTKTGSFNAARGSIVLSEDLTRVLAPDETEIGWLAKSGRMPLGYLGDPEKTAKTFILIDGTRYSVPGDRAHYNADGSIELLGRDSVCINSGGEKIFAEEVERALRGHPDVFDVVVAPRPSDRWGQEVVAVVALAEGRSPGEAELLEEAGRHIARYKLPKAFVFVDAIVRSPSGKADYRWAKERALEAGG